MEFTNKSILQRQYVSFDIDTNELKKYYPEDNWRKAYDDIRKHMQNHGFEWIQGSGYISTKPMATIKAHKTVKEFIQHNQWINKCMRDCRVFDVGKTNDLNVLFDKTVEVPIRTGYQEENKDYQKKHIQELKKNGFQPNKDIVGKMDKIDKMVGKYVGLKEIRDIFKSKNPDVSSECKKLANEIGQTLKSQELERVTYR